VNIGCNLPEAGAGDDRGSYPGAVHWYEIEIDGEALSIEADTWKRDLDGDAVVFVQRYREPTRPQQVLERELLRLHLQRPHRNIRRL
jgi:hypothetical protein